MLTSELMDYTNKWLKEPHHFVFGTTLREHLVCTFHLSKPSTVYETAAV